MTDAELQAAAAEVSGAISAAIPELFGGATDRGQAAAIAPAPAAPIPAERRQAMIDNLRKFWTGPPEELERALSASAATESSPAAEPAAAVDTRTEEMKSFDTAFGGIAPEQYDLRGLFVNRGLDLQTAGTLDVELRTVLSAIGAPPALARGLAGELLDSQARYASMPEGPRRQLWQREQRHILERIGRAPSEHLTLLASHALARAPEATREYLLNSGSFETAAAILQLAQQGKRLLLREQMGQRGKAGK